MGDTYRTNRRNVKYIQDFLRKRNGKRPPGKPTRRWEDNRKTDFKEIG